jgi:hypothetical protein
MSLEIENSGIEVGNGVTDAPKEQGTPLADASEQGGQDSGEAENETPAWQPNFKVKVMDKEYEIPEFMRAAVKDAETEKQIRELHEKAYGLDHIKPKFQETRESLKQLQNRLEQEHTPLVSQLQEIGKELQGGNLQSLLKAFNVPKDLLFKFVADELKYQEMSPEERQRIDRERQLAQQAEYGDKRTQALLSTLENQAYELRVMQLDGSLAKQEVGQMTQAVDAVLGQGAFRSEVIKQGQLHHAMTGQDLSVEQAVQAVMKKYEKLAAPAAPENAAQAPTALRVPEKKPTLPNIASTGASPAKKVIKSLKDLKSLSKEMNEQPFQQ